MVSKTDHIETIFNSIPVVKDAFLPIELGIKKAARDIENCWICNRKKLRRTQATESSRIFRPNSLLYGLDCHGLMVQQSWSSVVGYSEIVVIKINANEVFTRINAKINAVSYCGNDFNEDDWDFIFSNLKRLIQSAVVVMEETSENVNDFISGISSMEKENDTLEGLGHIVFISDPSINNAQNALSAFSLLNALVKHKSAEGEDNLNSLAYETWDPVKDRILEGVLRLFFCTGLAEAIAASYSPEAASIVASFRVDHLQFWELVAQLVVDSSPRARDRAVRAVEFWGLSKGAISSMYAIMFSSNPIPSLQLAAYIVLSTDPISRLAIVADGFHPVSLQEWSQHYDLIRQTIVAHSGCFGSILEFLYGSLPRPPDVLYVSQSKAYNSHGCSSPRC